MSLPNPASLSPAMKPIRKFLLQAKQLDKADPQVAYFCRLHAAKEGMKFKQTPEDLQFIISLMDWLENNNAARDISIEERKASVYEFISRLFYNADQADRFSPVVDDGVAKCFLAVAVLLEMYTQFGPLSEAEDNRRKYCLWKGVEIKKALKEGREPARGGFNDDAPTIDTLNVDNNNNNTGTYDAGLNNNEFGGNNYNNFDSHTPTDTNTNTYSNTNTTTNTNINTNTKVNQTNSSLPTIHDVHNSYGNGDDDDEFANFGYGGTNLAKNRPKINTNTPTNTNTNTNKPKTNDPFDDLDMDGLTKSKSPQNHSKNTSQPKTPSNSGNFKNSGNSKITHNPSDFLPFMTESEATIHAIESSRTSALSAAEKLCRHATSAMSFDDVSTAVKKLAEAMALLLPHQTEVEY